MNKYILLILGMALVTYIPRLLPFIVVSGKKLPQWVQRFLKYIPCTAMGALIIPGVFSSTPGAPWAALIGIAFAAAYSWIRGGIIVPVLGSVAIVFIIYLLG